MSSGKPTSDLLPLGSEFNVNDKDVTQVATLVIWLAMRLASTDDKEEALAEFLARVRHWLAVRTGQPICGCVLCRAANAAEE